MSRIEMLLAGHGDCLAAEVGTLIPELNAA